MAPELRASAGKKLKHVVLSNTILTTWQVNLLWQEMKESSQLNSLNITGINLSSVEPEMLASIVNKMEKVNLWYSKLTTQQVTVLCQVMKENSQLKSLHLGWNNLSSVEPELLASGLSKCENLNVWNTKLTTEQVTALYKVLKMNNPLKCLNLEGNSLSGVEPHLLATVVSKMEEVSLGSTKLTS